MRVLLIEDEPSVARFIRKGLEQEGYAVDLATDGETGLQLAIEEVYDLMVVDVMLPERDGLSVCRAVRRRRIHTPVLMLTAKDTVENKVSRVGQRGRRLPDQALQLRGTPGENPGFDAPPPRRSCRIAIRAATG